jgi:TetR/AcrR family transcriptional regulator, regulator of cefoperazone and chloramphenicol sensitivity
MVNADFQSNNAVNVVEAQDISGRLLEAAEELFCQKGFAGTSIRDITARANCNVAAVNYHFSNKENLYLAVFKRYLTQLRDNHINAVNRIMAEKGDAITLEEVLMSFAKAFMEPLIGEKRASRFITLMTREMLDPHLPADVLYNEMILPVQNVLQAAIRKIYPGIRDEDSALSIMSIFGQLSHIVRVMECVLRGGMTNELFEVNRLIEHVVKFSAAGIRAAVPR